MTRQENIAKAEDVRPFQQLGIGVQPSDEWILSLSCKKRKQRFNSWKSKAISQFTIDPGLQHFSLRFLSSYHKQPLHWRRQLDAFMEFMQRGRDQLPFNLQKNKHLTQNKIKFRSKLNFHKKMKFIDIKNKKICRQKVGFCQISLFFTVIR